MVSGKAGRGKVCYICPASRCVARLGVSQKSPAAQMSVALPRPGEVQTGRGLIQIELTGRTMVMWQYLLLNAAFVAGCTYQWGFGGFLVGVAACVVLRLFMRVS